MTDQTQPKLVIIDRESGKEYKFPKDIDYRFSILKEHSVPADYYLTVEHIFEKAGGENWFLVATSPTAFGYGEEDKRYFILNPDRFSISFEGVVSPLEIFKKLWAKRCEDSERQEDRTVYVIVDEDFFSVASTFGLSETDITKE